jgi:hypothetical protein
MCTHAYIITISVQHYICPEPDISLREVFVLEMYVFGQISYVNSLKYTHALHMGHFHS